MLFIGDLQLISIHMQASINTEIMFRPQKTWYKSAMDDESAAADGAREA